MRFLIALAMVISTTLCGGIIDENNYWAVTYKDGKDHTYSHKLALRTYKNSTYKVFHSGKEVEKGTITKSADKLYVLTSTTGNQVLLETQGEFAIVIRTKLITTSFINMKDPLEYEEE